MTESGYGHAGRIPNYGNRGHIDNRGIAEPPACIQNAMMTKDKKPFTYTPGGLDLSQIKTPSMARRMARQRSQEEEQGYAPHYNGHQTSSGPPPPPPLMQAGPPPPPPPPPLVIQTPSGATAKPQSVIKPIGERPEIVIPENPIGMLRKTNSPYHWEQEQADKDRMGAVPKFVDKVPSPVMQQNFCQQNAPQAFSQQPPSTYTPTGPNNINSLNNVNINQQRQIPESPVHKPEPQYPVKSSIPSPGVNQTPTRDMLQRQDSQFNKSPAPFGPQGHSPQTNGSPISPSPNNAWRQPEKRDSPLITSSPQQRSPFSPTYNNRQQFSPTENNRSPSYQSDNQSPVYHTLPRVAGRVPDNVRQSPPKNIFSNTIYNNVRNEPRSESPKVDPNNNLTPWRTQTLNRPQQRTDSSSVQTQNNQTFNNPSFYKPSQQEQAVQPPWKANQESDIDPWRQNSRTMKLDQPSENNVWHQKQQNSPQNTKPLTHAPESRYQSSMSIPITQNRPQQQQFEQQRPPSQQLPVQGNREVVFVTQEPVYYHNPDSPKTITPLWVKNQKEKTPPPEWVQRPLERKSLPRDIISPQKEPLRPFEPEWVQKSAELRSGNRELSSPPPTHQTVQPTWSTKPSDNRKNLPQETPNYGSQNGHNPQGARTVPIQIHNESTGDKPQLRIVIDMQNPHGQQQIQQPYSQPTQRIMRVLSPQLVRLDQQDASPRQQDLPSLNNQPKTRIIPIQIEGGGNEAPNRSVGGRY